MPSKHFSASSARNCLFSFIPIFEWLPRYSLKEHLLADFVAGLTVGVMAVPQSMSYATVAGLQPYYGLYSAFVGLLPYPLFGSSSHVVPGPTAVVAILLKGSIPPTLNGHPMVPASTDPTEIMDYTNAALLLTFLTGIMQVILGTAGLGFLVQLISEPVIIAFTSAAGFVIASTQFGNLLGLSKCVSVEGSCLFHQQVYHVLANIPSINVPTLICSLVSCIFLMIFMFKIKTIPKLKLLGSMGPLILVLIALPSMAALLGAYGEDPVKKVDKHFGIAYIGSIPAGLPSPRSPLVGSSVPEFARLIPGALVVSAVGFMESITISKTMYAQKGGLTPVRPSQEFFALGMCNFVSSWFQGFAGTGAISRTAVNADCGAKSAIAALVAAIVVGISLLVLTPFLAFMPKFVLASIVFTSVLKLINFQEPRFLYRVSRRDFTVFMLVFLTTLFLGIETGLIIGILTNWALMLLRTRSTHATVLGRRAAEAAEVLDNAEQTDGLLGDGSAGRQRGISVDGAETADIQIVHGEVTAEGDLALRAVSEESAAKIRRHRSNSAVLAAAADASGDGVELTAIAVQQSAGDASTATTEDMGSQLLGEGAPLVDVTGQETDAHEKVVLLHLHSDLFFATCNNFKATVDLVLQRYSPHTIIIDCTHLRSIDASGLHTLAAVTKQLAGAQVEACFDEGTGGVQLALAALTRSPRAMLRACRDYKEELQGLWDLRMRSATRTATEGGKWQVIIEVEREVAIADGDGDGDAEQVEEEEQSTSATLLLYQSVEDAVVASAARNGMCLEEGEAGAGEQKTASEGEAADGEDSVPSTPRRQGNILKVVNPRVRIGRAAESKPDTWLARSSTGPKVALVEATDTYTWARD